MVIIVIGISFIIIFFLLNHNNVRAFSFSMITNAIKCVLHKVPEGEKSALLVADYIPALGRDSRSSFSADLTNVRMRISDRRIQFHRDVISVFSANYVTRASSLSRVYGNILQSAAAANSKDMQLNLLKNITRYTFSK